jgi:hypothetical protein
MILIEIKQEIQKAVICGSGADIRLFLLADAERSGCHYFETLPGLFQMSQNSYLFRVHRIPKIILKLK